MGGDSRGLVRCGAVWAGGLGLGLALLRWVVGGLDGWFGQSLLRLLLVLLGFVWGSLGG